MMFGVEEWTLWNEYEVQIPLLMQINSHQKAFALEEALNKQDSTSLSI